MIWWHIVSAPQHCECSVRRSTVGWPVPMENWDCRVTLASVIECVWVASSEAEFTILSFLFTLCAFILGIIRNGFWSSWQCCGNMRVWAGDVTLSRSHLWTYLWVLTCERAYLRKFEAGILKPHRDLRMPALFVSCSIKDDGNQYSNFPLKTSNDAQR